MTYLLSKMESFIRSKYESRRWALEGSPPEDPSTLENGQEVRTYKFNVILDSL